MAYIKFTIDLEDDHSNTQEESLEFEIGYGVFTLAHGDKLADFIINTLPQMLKQAGIDFVGD